MRTYTQIGCDDGGRGNSSSSSSSLEVMIMCVGFVSQHSMWCTRHGFLCLCLCVNVLRIRLCFCYCYDDRPPVRVSAILISQCFFFFFGCCPPIRCLHMSLLYFELDFFLLLFHFVVLWLALLLVLLLLSYFSFSTVLFNGFSWIFIFCFSFFLNEFCFLLGFMR